ncbi:nuclear transport factor 2 family protein [Streptacidiphilus sp. PAMC 29251]
MYDTAPTGVLADHIKAVNAFDLDGIVATFADDALVNDARREFWGIDAIRAWAAKEMVGDRVTLRVTEVAEHHGVTLVRAAYSGDYPRPACRIR